MSASDYEVHLDFSRLSSLWGDGESEVEGFAFGEDAADIERIIEEELGPSRRRRGARVPRRA